MSAHTSRRVTVAYAGRRWRLLAAHETAACIERRGNVRWVPLGSLTTERTGTGLRQRHHESPRAFLARCLSHNPTLSARAARTRGQEDS